MVMDTSAFLAIFLAEAERRPFLDLIVQAETVQAETVQAETHLVSSSTALEAGVVLETRRGEAASREFDLFLVRANVEVVPVDAEQAEIARSAWRKYGKGRAPGSPQFRAWFRLRSG
jgi:ribonuclease VapC